MALRDGVLLGLSEGEGHSNDSMTDVETGVRGARVLDLLQDETCGLFGSDRLRPTVGFKDNTAILYHMKNK